MKRWSSFGAPACRGTVSLVTSASNCNSRSQTNHHAHITGMSHSLSSAAAGWLLWCCGTRQLRRPGAISGNRATRHYVGHRRGFNDVAVELHSPWQSLEWRFSSGVDCNCGTLLARRVISIWLVGRTSSSTHHSLRVLPLPYYRLLNLVVLESLYYRPIYIF